MDAKLFQQLVDCNAEKSWELVRDIVGVQLMGKDYFYDYSLQLQCLSSYAAGLLTF